jgi:hypothetical protein
MSKLCPCQFAGGGECSFPDCYSKEELVASIESANQRGVDLQARIEELEAAFKDAWPLMALKSKWLAKHPEHAKTLGDLATTSRRIGHTCTAEDPWKPEYGYPVAHTNAHEYGEQETGWPSGDIVTMKCGDCGATWKTELPQ